MRHQRRLALVALVATIALTAGHPWRPAVGASSVVPGVGLADIEVGMPIADVLTRFGTPSVARLTNADGLLGYGFDRYGIIVYAHGDIVQAVGTTNSVVGSVDGIGIGTRLSRVVQTLGPAYSPGFVEGYPAYVYPTLGMAFGLDHQAVVAILVFKPVSGATVQPVHTTAPSAPAASPASVDSAIAGSVQAVTTIPGLSPSSPAAPVAADAPHASASPALPDVNRLKPYSADTNFLSLAGYLRYLVQRDSKLRVSPDEGEHLMRIGISGVR